MAMSIIKWKRHQEQQPLGLYEQLIHQQFTDFYMVAEGQSMGAHKNVMAAQSSFLEKLLLLSTDKAPIIILSWEVSFKDLENLVQYCYTGECVVPTEGIEHFLKVGHSMGIKGLIHHEQINASLDVDLPQTPTPAPIQMTSPHQEAQEVSSSQVAIPEIIVVADAEVPNNKSASLKKVVRPKRDRKKFSIRLPPSQVLQVKSKSKRKALEPADENVQMKVKISKPSTADTSEKLLLKCQFCPRLYTSKSSKHTHQRECDNNPERVQVQCQVCDKVFKPTAMPKHKKTHDLE